jgi:hypothetical protein
MSTIAVRLKGGLGNQLFQWALARELTARGHDVVLEDRQVRNGIGVQISALLDAAVPGANCWPSLGERLSDRLRIPLTFSGYRKWSERSFAYEEEVLLSPPRRCLLDGYWQSERYFLTVAPQVRSVVKSYCSSLLTASGEDLIARIRGERYAVSVHVRRGDYVSNPVARAFHGVLPLSYYEAAMTSLSQVGASHFFFFSDDPDWVRDHMDTREGTVVDHNVAVRAAGELALMAECSGHVIANSSFSWWGAWLDDTSASQVRAPARWFSRPDIDTRDLLPARWLRL